MRGYKDFIVQIPEKYSQTFKTESGIELHADRRFSAKLVANNVVHVLEIPLNYKGEINIGDIIMVDPTLLMFQTYVKGGEQENINLVDREKGLYKVDPSLIIMHRPKDGEWYGYGDNLLLRRVDVEKPKTVNKKSLIVVPDSAVPKKKYGKAVLKYGNPELFEQGVENGDVLYFNETLFVDVWFDNIQYLWVKNKYLLGVEIKKAS